MAPIKFEEQLKDKLEKRTLSPSADSWSKLSNRLDADENKSKKSIFWWLSIAAGLVIMLAITVQFFTADDSEKVIPQVVEKEGFEEKATDKNSEVNADKSIELVNDNSSEIAKDKLPITNQIELFDYKNGTNSEAQPKTQFANLNKKSKTNEFQNREEASAHQFQNESNDLLLKNAVAEALSDLKVANTSTTDKEVDSLLKLASKQLFKEKLQEQTIKTVDAGALLMSVEDEMGQSFRSKVFEALKESYATVKTAVVERKN